MNKTRDVCKAKRLSKCVRTPAHLSAAGAVGSDGIGALSSRRKLKPGQGTGGVHARRIPQNP